MTKGPDRILVLFVVNRNNGYFKNLRRVEDDFEMTTDDYFQKNKMIFNIFRILGDLCHLLSFIVLLSKIKKTKSCYGRS